MQNLDWLSDALGEFEDDYVRFNPLSLSLSLSFLNSLFQMPSTVDH